jgi:hypothetical protein
MMSHHPLTIRSTIVGGVSLENDYSVFRGNALIGRIRLNEVRWDWVINPPSDSESWATGQEKSLDRAKMAITNAWIGYYKTLLSEPPKGLRQ